MEIITDAKKIDELLTRGVEEVIVEESLLKKLTSGEKLRVKFGIDPTGADLHIGHAVPLRKLKQFQELGHQVILLIGDYTAKIGDPSGKKETRPALTDEEIKENMKNYIEQASKVLSMDDVEIRYNSEWYDKKDSRFMLELTSKVTVARVLERSDFKDRLSEDTDIHMQEILYPLLQGYDSVELKSDVEIGGTDQTFNLLMGRRIQKRYGQESQDVITVPILEGLDGELKMSKTYDNYIGLTDAPEEMYGKVMSIPDHLIVKYFELATDVALDEIDTIRKEFDSGVNPRDKKMQLAYELTKLYHGEDGAKQGKDHFALVIQNKDIPEDLTELKPSEYDIVTILVEAGFVKSNSDARRAVDQGGVKVNEEKIDSIEYEVKPGDVIQKGKRFFVRIV